MSQQSKEVIDDRLEPYDLREEDITNIPEGPEFQTSDISSSVCDSCLLRPPDRIRVQVAQYLCYVCKVHVCDMCFGDHETHDCVKVQSDRGERERMGHGFIGQMSSKFMDKASQDEFVAGSGASVYARVNIKTSLDSQDCYVAALEVQNKSWIVLDCGNSCIKVYNMPNNQLRRYVSFGSKPEDFTLVPSASVDGNLTAHVGNSQTLAVTFPSQNQIWFVDIGNRPARVTRKIRTEKSCRKIDFQDGKIFVLSIQQDWPLYYDIYTFSTEGRQLNVVRMEFYVEPIQLISGETVYPLPPFSVGNGRAYCTDFFKNKIVCVDLTDGKTISSVDLPNSGPTGIDIDEQGNVFVCGQKDGRIYKLDSGLRVYKQFDSITGQTVNPFRLKYFKDRLFVSHEFTKPFRNFVTVINLL